MDDVTRALEKAAEAIAEEDGASAATPVDRIWARAAVLAFLKAMPALARHKVSTGDGGHAYVPGGWNLHELAAAIEEEQP